MHDDHQHELLTDAVNKITQSVSEVLLKEFLKLPENQQISFVLIKSAQLLLANVLCQVAMDKDELETVANAQGVELKELTLDCATSGFGEKFTTNKH